MFTSPAVFDTTFDYVRARSDEGDLPRIPPFRVRTGAEARTRYVDARIEVLHADDQDEVDDFELETDSHTLLNASLIFRPLPDRRDFTFAIEGRNLTDQDARNHVSFTKDILPLPGRDVRFLARITF